MNYKPIVPGHVLVIPKKATKRYIDLSPLEVSDLWLTAQEIGSKEKSYTMSSALFSQVITPTGKQLEKQFKTDSLTFVIQDGPSARRRRAVSPGFLS